MRALWTRTSSGIGLLFVALGVILADRQQEIEASEFSFR
jgi:hypothetical protein